MADGVTIDLSRGDLDDEAFCFWQACSVEIPEDDDAAADLPADRLVRLRLGSAEVCAVLMTGQGTTAKVLEGGYGPPLRWPGGRRRRQAPRVQPLDHRHADEHGETMAVAKPARSPRR